MTVTTQARATTRGIVAARSVAPFLSAGGSALLTLMTASLLRPEERGQVAAVVLVAMLGAQVCSLGVPGWALRETARAGAVPLEVRRVVSTQLLLVSAVSPLLAWGLAPLLGGPVVATAAVLALLAWTLLTSATWVDYGLDRLVWPTVVKGVVPAAAAGVIVALGAKGDIEVAEVAVIFASVSLAGAVLYLLTSGLRPAAPSVAALVAATGYARSFWVQQTAVLVLQRGDQMVLSASRSWGALGQYGVAASLAEVATYIPTMLGVRAFGATSRGQQGPSTAIVLTITVGVLCTLCLPASFVLSWWLGENYGQLWLYVLLAAPGVLAQSWLRLLTGRAAGRDRMKGANRLLTAAALTGPAAAAAVLVVGGPAAAVLVLGCISLVVTALVAREARS